MIKQKTYKTPDTLLKALQQCLAKYKLRKCVLVERWQEVVIGMTCADGKTHEHKERVCFYGFFVRTGEGQHQVFWISTLNLANAHPLMTVWKRKKK